MVSDPTLPSQLMLLLGEVPFNPTWKEWTAFAVINAIIISIQAALYFRGNLRKVDNIYSGDGQSQPDK